MHIPQRGVKVLLHLHVPIVDWGALWVFALVFAGIGVLTFGTVLPA